MRKIKIYIPLFFFVLGPAISIMGILGSLFDLDKYKYWPVIAGISISLLLSLIDRIAKKKKEVSIEIGIAMIAFGVLFFLGSLVLFKWSPVLFR